MDAPGGQASRRRTRGSGSETGLEGRFRGVGWVELGEAKLGIHVSVEGRWQEWLVACGCV